MRYHAARMHKKAVRRAKHERHRFTKHRRHGKCAQASPYHCVHSTSRFTKPKRKTSIPRVHTIVLPLAPGHEKTRAAILPWLVLLTLGLPATLNYYHFVRPRVTVKSESAPALLPFDDLPLATEHQIHYPLAAENLEVRNWTTAIYPRGFVHEGPTSTPLMPLQVDSLPLMAATDDFEETPPRRLHWDRLIAAQAVTLGVGVYGLNYMNGIFGGVAQPFEVGNDWNKDHFMHFDELLHLQGAYRVSQAVSGVYQWAGVKPRTADWIGAATAATFMTTMEYIDGRREHDEASYTDFTANFLGAGLAVVKPRVSALQDFDLRLSYRTPADPFDRKLMKRYDRMTHWLTYDLQRRWKLPLHVGIGYSVQRPGTPRAKAQYFFGVGISPQAVLRNIIPAAAQPLSWLDLYHFGNQVPINEAGTTRKGKNTRH